MTVPLLRFLARVGVATAASVVASIPASVAVLSRQAHAQGGGVTRFGSPGTIFSEVWDTRRIDKARQRAAPLHDFEPVHITRTLTTAFWFAYLLNDAAARAEIEAGAAYVGAAGSFGRSRFDGSHCFIAPCIGHGCRHWFVELKR